MIRNSSGAAPTTSALTCSNPKYFSAESDNSETILGCSPSAPVDVLQANDLLVSRIASTDGGARMGGMNSGHRVWSNSASASASVLCAPQMVGAAQTLISLSAIA